MVRIWVSRAGLGIGASLMPSGCGDQTMRNKGLGGCDTPRKLAVSRMR